MEAIFREIASALALGVEMAAVLLVTIGAVQALFLRLPSMLGRHQPGVRREAWQQFARWLLLALEFELGSDIIRSAIAPTWSDIGQLAGIALIRTFLNYFLERDLEAGSENKADA
jgi:uncharacterized membrane protein